MNAKTPFEIHQEYMHDPDGNGVAIDPITGIYQDEYVEWLEKKVIEREQYAKEMEVEFAKWCADNDWNWEPTFNYWSTTGIPCITKTTDEVHNIFLKEREGK